MLTDDETRLIAYAYALRHDETDKDLWFATPDVLLPECHRLVYERGYLERRRHGDDYVYRLTDQAMAAQELYKLVAGQSAN